MFYWAKFSFAPPNQGGNILGGSQSEKKTFLGPTLFPQAQSENMFFLGGGEPQKEEEWYFFAGEFFLHNTSRKYVAFDKFATHKIFMRGQKFSAPSIRFIRLNFSRATTPNRETVFWGDPPNKKKRFGGPKFLAPLLQSKIVFYWVRNFF